MGRCLTCSVLAFPPGSLPCPCVAVCVPLQAQLSVASSGPAALGTKSKFPPPGGACALCLATPGTCGPPVCTRMPFKVGIAKAPMPDGFVTQVFRKRQPSSLQAGNTLHSDDGQEKLSNRYALTYPSKSGFFFHLTKMLCKQEKEISNLPFQVE